MSLRYLYALAREFGDPPMDQLPDTPGIAGAPVRLISHRGIVAAVSDVPESDFAEEPLRAHLEDVRWLAEVARTHDTVVRALDARTVTAPMRLATIFRDDAAVTERLASWHDAARDALDGLTGRHEWGVKAYLQVPEVDVPQAEPPTGVGAGHAYLQRRRTERSRTELARRQAMQQVNDLYASLAAHAVSARTNPPQDPRLSRHAGIMLLNASFLIDTDRNDEFRAAVARASRPGGNISVELTGPWPPYSFAKLEAS